jgi:hypothetical protein
VDDRYIREDSNLKYIDKAKPAKNTVLQASVFDILSLLAWIVLNLTEKNIVTARKKKRT